MAGFFNDILYADNVDFTGNVAVSPQVTADGQLLIGATASPNIRVGSLTSTGGSIDITVGAGTINLETDGSVATQYDEDTGSAVPAAGVLNIVGTAAQGISTSGATNVVTITAANASAVQKGVASFDATEFTAAAGNITSNAMTLTAGTGITLSTTSLNLGGSLTISATGSGVTWNDIAVNTLGVVDNGYFCTASLTLTLPAAPTQGQVVWVVSDVAGTVTITANTGQTIRISNSASSVAGTAASTLRGDAVQLVFRAANSTWIAANGAAGAWILT